VTISWRFVVVLALGIVPIIYFDSIVALGWWLLALLVLCIIDLLLAGSPRALRLERVLPQAIRLGESTTAELFVTNAGRRTVRGRLRDGWQPSAGATNNHRRLVIPSGERRAFVVPLTPFRRGERRAVHVTVRSFGPLGIAARQASILAPGAVRVLPPFNARKHLPSRLAKLRELDGATSVMVRGQGTEFDSLRDYVRGDDVRSIDWRATARRKDLVVRTWRPERDRRVVIIVDSGRTAAARIDSETRLDTAFESALLLAALATRAGDRVDLVIYDRRVRGRVQGATGPELLNRMVNSMATVEPELIEMDWSVVPGLVRSISSSRSLVILATSIDAPGASRGLLAMLPQLSKKHLVVVSSVIDPDVLATTERRATREGIYLAAAAERALLDTARVSSAIRQSGAEVVTGSPADLPPALADRYIALKAAGRL